MAPRIKPEARKLGGWRLGAVVLALGMGGFLALAIPGLFFGHMFDVDVAIANNSNRSVNVTLVGVGEHGELITAPPALWGAGEPSIHLDQSETRTAGYNWDDINLCWLLVESEGLFKLVPTGLGADHCPTNGRSDRFRCCLLPPHRTLEVPDFETIANAPPEIVALVRQLR